MSILFKTFLILISCGFIARTSIIQFINDPKVNTIYYKPSNYITLEYKYAYN